MYEAFSAVKAKRMQCTGSVSLSCVTDMSHALPCALPGTPSSILSPCLLPLPAGMLCAETGAMIWLLLATYLELPVSSTHSIGEAPLLLMMCSSSVDCIFTESSQPCLLRPVLLLLLLIKRRAHRSL
jgi:hypothetical protein